MLVWTKNICWLQIPAARLCFWIQHWNPNPTVTLLYVHVSPVRQWHKSGNIYMSVSVLDPGRKSGVVAMWWDGACAILSILSSAHQRLWESAHVISPRCNLLGLQLKACFDGMRLSTSPWTRTIRSSQGRLNDVMTDAVIEYPPPCITLTNRLPSRYNTNNVI